MRQDPTEWYSETQAYLILAVVLGAGLGHFYLNEQMDIENVLGADDGKGMACH